MALSIQNVRAQYGNQIRGNTYVADNNWFCAFFLLRSFFGIERLDIPNSAAIPSSRSPR